MKIAKIEIDFFTKCSITPIELLCIRLEMKTIISIPATIAPELLAYIFVEQFIEYSKFTGHLAEGVYMLLGERAFQRLQASARRMFNLHEELEAKVDNEALDILNQIDPSVDEFEIEINFYRYTCWTVINGVRKLRFRSEPLRSPNESASQTRRFLSTSDVIERFGDSEYIDENANDLEASFITTASMIKKEDSVTDINSTIDLIERLFDKHKETISDFIVVTKHQTDFINNEDITEIMSRIDETKARVLADKDILHRLEEVIEEIVSKRDELTEGTVYLQLALIGYQLVLKSELLHISETLFE